MCALTVICNTPYGIQPRLKTREYIIRFIYKSLYKIHTHY